MTDLKHDGVIIRGLSSSGKSCLASNICNALRERLGLFALILETDQLNKFELLPKSSFDMQSRLDRGLYLASMAMWLKRSGVIPIIAGIGQDEVHQAWLACFANPFVILLDIPLEDCILRDTRGVYSSGVDVVGLDLAFEKPSKSDLIICDPQLSSIEISEMALRLMKGKNGKNGK